VNLNSRAAALCRSLGDDAERLGIEFHTRACGTVVIDFGAKVVGSLEAGVLLARVCMADLGAVTVGPAEAGEWSQVVVETDEPVLACMASQYAGWEVKGEKYFAMGSGPMRAAAAREPLFAELGYAERADQCVGVLESGKLPTEEVCEQIAAKCGVAPSDLTLLVAATRSVAGTLQIVARSVETALHKLHELKFDLKRVVRGRGSAPLPPLANDDFAAIGRTNDAILYGARVVLEVRGDDASLEEIGPQTPSRASKDYGKPFAETLAAYDNEFYKVDPLLFSPAEITFANLDSGRSFTFGGVNAGVLEESFGSHRSP
jgi:methenyltetrahydromethanopterin cyclohydrolase